MSACRVFNIARPDTITRRQNINSLISFRIFAFVLILNSISRHIFLIFYRVIDFRFELKFQLKFCYFSLEIDTISLNVRCARLFLAHRLAEIEHKVQIKCVSINYNVEWEVYK